MANKKPSCVLNFGVMRRGPPICKIILTSHAMQPSLMHASDLTFPQCSNMIKYSYTMSLFGFVSKLMVL